MLEPSKNSANYWSRFADSYDEKFERMFGKDLRKRLFSLLEGERRLGEAVELGCGTGYFTRAIARNATHVTATDLSPQMLEVARKRLADLHNVSYRVENGESTTFPPDSFDTVLAANMLHTLDDPIKSVRECRRILKKGGSLLIVNYTEEGLSGFERIWLGFRFDLEFGFPPKKSWPISRKKLRSLLENTGLTIERLDLIRDRINAVYARAKKI